jgi:hypothetical protein
LQSTILFTVSLILLICAGMDTQPATAESQRRLRRVVSVSFYLALACCFLLLSLSVPIRAHLEVLTETTDLVARTTQHRTSWITAEAGATLIVSFGILSAVLRIAERLSRKVRRLDGKVGLEVGWRVPATAIVACTLGIAVVHLAAPTGAPAGRGAAPLHWFPSTAAFLGCLLALHLAAAERNRIGSLPGSLLAVQALAGVNLALSLGYAANSPVHQLLDRWPALQSGWMFSIGAVLLMTGMFAARISNSGVAAAGLLAWSTSFVARPFVDPGSWAVLGFLAQLALLAALGALLMERVRQSLVVGSERISAVYPTQQMMDSRRRTA